MSFVGDIFDSVTGKGQADAAKDSSKAQIAAQQLAMEEQRRAAALAMEEQRRASAEGQGYLAPFGAIGQQGLDQMGFLNDSQAQYDWLQGNPLFQMGLDNANQVTQASSAARGRLSAGDTLMQLNNNALLTASPLIADRKNDIWNQLGMGQSLATTQANTALGLGSNLASLQSGLGNTLSGLQTGIGNSRSAGIIGAQNGRDQGLGNMLNLGGLAYSAFGGGAPDYAGANNDVGLMFQDGDLF